MAKKSVILSNGDGKVAFSNTSSVYIEDSTDSFVTTQVTASSLKINSLPSGENLLFINNKIIDYVLTGSINSSPLLWNGTSWQTSSLNYTKYTGTAGGDLSGSFPNPVVTNVNNVNTGILPISRGGTGISYSGPGFFKAHNNFISTIGYSGSPMEQKLLINKNREWVFSTPRNTPLVYLITSSGLWYPPEDKKYARVLCIGGGGGGGAGRSLGSVAGGGGGGGGVSEKIIDISYMDRASITIGQGGAGGFRTFFNLADCGGVDGGTYPSPGYSGESTVFTFFGKNSDQFSITAGGGVGGATIGYAYNCAWPNYDMSYNRPVGAGGTGTTVSGGTGGANNADTAAVYCKPSGGGSGARPIATTPTPARSGGAKTGIFSEFFNYTVDAYGNSLPSTLFGIGAAGGTSTTAPPKPTVGFGGGGGGGAAVDTGLGGVGGDGCIFIVCW